MGFWSAVGKILQGKPVFENPEHLGSDRDDVESADAAVPAKPGYDEKGQKIIPKISISRCQSHMSGDRMQVWVWVKNEAAVPVRLERTTMIGATRQLGNFLSPGEQEQVELYNGSRPRINSYTKAEMYYMQINTNDYFCAEYEVEYEYESDGTYTVSELHPYSYVKDV